MFEATTLGEHSPKVGAFKAKEGLVLIEVCVANLVLQRREVSILVLVFVPILVPLLFPVSPSDLMSLSNPISSFESVLENPKITFLARLPKLCSITILSFALSRKQLKFTPNSLSKETRRSINKMWVVKLEFFLNSHFEWPSH